MTYDPNEVGQNNGQIFSLPHSYEEAKVILLPVPWDITTSFNDGTSNAPQVILEASSQLDLYDPLGIKVWEYGAFMMPVNPTWKLTNNSLRKKAKQYIHWLENGSAEHDKELMADYLSLINSESDRMHAEVKLAVKQVIKDGKPIGLIGGEHSCSLGLIEALCEEHDSIGILQIDAHADLRETYENFKHSHASIFHNLLKFKSIHTLTQVGLRDISPAEEIRIQSDSKINSFFDWDIKRQLFEGKTWSYICQEIISTLPEKVYISFDIDGLSPSLCPNTGTPVPGGLQFEEAIFLIESLYRSGKHIIGFDLCEVGNGEWDGNVGARLLLKLCNVLYGSNTFPR